MQILIGYIILLLVGLSLGLLGGGGGILAIPSLTEFFGFSMKEAVPISLLLVGISSSLGAFHSLKSGQTSFKIVFPFLLASIIGAFCGAKLAHLISEKIQIISFATLLLISSILLFNKKESLKPSLVSNKEMLFQQSLQLIVSGSFVGIITGILGVGGGFLIVPVFIIILNMPTKTAISTSIVIICFNSIFGLLGYIDHFHPNLFQMFSFIFLILIGMFIGLKLKEKIKEKILQKAFSIVMLIVSIQMFLKVLSNY